MAVDVLWPLARRVAKNFSMGRFSASVDLERLRAPAWR
jgi:hypothetical protein